MHLVYVTRYFISNLNSCRNYTLWLCWYNAKKSGPDLKETIEKPNIAVLLIFGNSVLTFSCLICI